ncbi:hypothetical protein GH714_039458 [Hevea brasiliensis]|uniref:Uncharacterized protein n=1 Tax=Hevea brasiliensis TaxID=3981 RepID=A0A6A6KEN4_HEVBR|nr:hypothetical protein GH714_039458 [Hevea brasiliensis]
MKRKKWSEHEEQTLLTKYSDLLTSGTLSKLKTREKKFRPIADHVNSVHHLQDPVSFPFKWSWRDVSIKVQNMRHQYLGVKQKIRISKDEFNWKDGENHWENFLKYKEVFGDVELEVKSKKSSDSCSNDLFKDCGDLGFGIDSEDLEEEEEEEDGEEEGENGDDDNVNGGGEEEGEFGGEKGNDEMGIPRKAKVKKGLGGNRRLGLLGAQVVDLRDVIDHEKAMMQIQADAFQNQMQILGLMARLICQFFGANDGLGGGLGGLPLKFCRICSTLEAWAIMGSLIQIRLLNSCRV